MPADRLPPDELIEIRELELDFLEELMSEPAHGHNHGRSKGEGGGWHTLETDPIDIPSTKRLPVPTPHGTSYAYRKLKCRCQVCRQWKRDENARR